MVAIATTNIRTNDIPKAWLGGLLRQVSPRAIKHIAVQRRNATASRLEGNVLNPCAQPCQFQQQFGLPCAHIIRDLQDRDEDLTIQHIHPRWWMQSPQ
ncbi:hypothetical protein E4U40_007581, partial [Claviceps sp. LM458 group G5]